MKLEDKIEVELLANGQFEVRTGQKTKKPVNVAIVAPVQEADEQQNGVVELMDLLKRSFFK